MGTYRMKREIPSRFLENDFLEDSGVINNSFGTSIAELYIKVNLPAFTLKFQLFVEFTRLVRVLIRLRSHTMD